jgi:hypothetical protein
MNNDVYRYLSKELSFFSFEVKNAEGVPDEMAL